MRAIDLHSKSLAQRFGLTGPQLIILRELSEFGEVPVGGFFCGGEFGPVGGKNFVHGFTASIALFSQP